MEKNFLTALIVSIIYVLLGIIDSRFIKKDAAPLKSHMKSSVLVFISVLMGSYLIGFMVPSSGSGAASTPAFTGAPDF
jgi:hypothetical protein